MIEIGRIIQNAGSGGGSGGSSNLNNYSGHILSLDTENIIIGNFLNILSASFTVSIYNESEQLHKSFNVIYGLKDLLPKITVFGKIGDDIEYTFDIINFSETLLISIENRELFTLFYNINGSFVIKTD